MNTEHTHTLVESSLCLLRSLVAFDTVSRNSNLQLITFVEQYLQEHGVYSQRILSPDGRKSNLLARIGPETKGGIVLSGHTDVVPVDGQIWDTDPFAVTERDGKFYGRGTADMKSFVAICLAMVPEFIAAAKTKPVWLAFSYDEEVGCLGAPFLLEHMVQHIPLPAFAIIGEPTLMQVVTAHKGVISFETTVYGVESHSSRPHEGVNAVHIACELVCFLQQMGRELETAGLSDKRFVPAYSTVHVGTINGGTARNIIPRECKFQWEIRPLPGENYEVLTRRFQAHCDELQARMQAKFSQAYIHTQPMSRMAGVTLPVTAQSSCQAVMRCAHTNQEHAVSFGTEAGVFNDHGVPAIICGPGSIEQAHKPNEFIEREQIKAAVEFMLRLTSDPALSK